MIASFGDKGTEALYHGRPSKDVRRIPPGIVRVALRKLDMLNAATTLGDLRSPPGNRLEDTSPEFWLNLQAAYDLAESRPSRSIKKLRKAS